MRVVAVKGKEKYYDSTEIDKTNATYKLVIGSRSLTERLIVQLKKQ